MVCYAVVDEPVAMSGSPWWVRICSINKQGNGKQELTNL